jgi:1-deoxy-D-xylulose-5-phosphate synthase
MLDRIGSPADLKRLSYEETLVLASEIRERMIKIISENGGHLASSLGAVELTIALHRIFDSPYDKIIWDVGHQAYAHKMLTGRLDKFDTIRQYGGLSGFPVPNESPHDAFVAGHAGNSISAALGMAIARDLNKEKFEVIAIVGDGSVGAGMSFEAINHAGHAGTKLIVILNDNGMSISPSVGALSRLMSQVRTRPNYERAKKTAKNALNHLPFGDLAWTMSRRMKTGLEGLFLPSSFWEQLGFNYIGPIDGHSIKDLESILTVAKNIDTGPVLVHIVTRKGKGYPDAESDVIRYHGISPNGTRKSIGPNYSQVFSIALNKIMKENDKVVAITAAMLEGTGLKKTAQEFPGRVFDVGICEQHAVTLAAGLATRGFIPVVAIYSTFLQRAYDQIIHDVCLQNLPVVFAIDRAGIVGDDGKTHQGPFDISFLRCIPDIIVSSPADEDELQHLLYTAVKQKQPFAIRYPRGAGEGVPLSSLLTELPVGKGELIKDGSDLTIVAAGPVVNEALVAAENLSNEGIDCAVINARYIKPLDSKLIASQLSKTDYLLTIEEGSLMGGFGSAVLEFIHSSDFPDIKARCLGIPDRFIEHGTQEQLRSILKIDTSGIETYIKSEFPELLPNEHLVRNGKKNGTSQSIDKVSLRNRRRN